MDNTIWLPIGEATIYLQERGIKISKVGIVKMGALYKFSRKQVDGFHWEFNKEGLDKYCASRKPLGKKYTTIAELAELFNTTYTIIYNFLNRSELEKTYREGQIYVNKQEFVEKYKEKHNVRK